MCLEIVDRCVFDYANMVYRFLALRIDVYEERVKEDRMKATFGKRDDFPYRKERD
jgi:hypothetical protein